jgi:hypothetical protein
MNYQTRHLTAKIDLLHDGRYVAQGSSFHASETDSEYLVGNHQAIPADGVEEPQALAALPRRRGRPPVIKQIDQTQETEEQSSFESNTAAQSASDA